MLLDNCGVLRRPPVTLGSTSQLDVFLAAIVLLLSALTTGAFQFEATGHVATTLRSGDSVSECSFRAKFARRQSLISVSYLNGEVIESGTDGTDSYTLNKMAVVRKKNPNQSEFAYITSGVFPEKNLMPAQMIWIALGFFGGDEELESLPLEILRKFPKTACTVDVARAKQIPYPPETVKWFAPDYFMYETNKVRLEAYREGWLAAEFSVVGWTNVADLTLPGRFELRTYRPLHGTSQPISPTKPREDVELVSVTSATVDSISEIHNFSEWLPALSHRVIIQDWRFLNQTHGQPLNYTLYNGRWPKADASSLKDLLAQRYGMTAQRGKSRIMRVFLLVLCVMPLLGILWWKGTRTNKQQKEY